MRPCDRLLQAVTIRATRGVKSFILIGIASLLHREGNWDSIGTPLSLVRLYLAGSRWDRLHGEETRESFCSVLFFYCDWDRDPQDTPGFILQAAPPPVPHLRISATGEGQFSHPPPGELTFSATTNIESYTRHTTHGAASPPIGVSDAGQAYEHTRTHNSGMCVSSPSCAQRCTFPMRCCHLPTPQQGSGRVRSRLHHWIRKSSPRRTTSGSDDELPTFGGGTRITPLQAPPMVETVRLPPWWWLRRWVRWRGHGGAISLELVHAHNAAAATDAADAAGAGTGTDAATTTATTTAADFATTGGCTAVASTTAAAADTTAASCDRRNDATVAAAAAATIAVAGAVAAAGAVVGWRAGGHAQLAKGLSHAGLHPTIVDRRLPRHALRVRAQLTPELHSPRLALQLVEDHSNHPLRRKVQHRRRQGRVHVNVHHVSAAHAPLAQRLDEDL